MGVVLKQEHQMVPKPVSIGIDVIRFARAKSVDFENKIWAKLSFRCLRVQRTSIKHDTTQPSDDGCYP